MTARALNMSGRLTPRKRKLSSLGSDCFLPAVEAPVKKLLLDFSTESPVKTPTKFIISPLSRKFAETYDGDKENSGSIHAAPNQLLKSPLQTVCAPRSIYRLSPLKPQSPQHGSPCQNSMSAWSFYSKRRALYLTPLERKTLNESKPLVEGVDGNKVRSPPQINKVLEKNKNSSKKTSHSKTLNSELQSSKRANCVPKQSELKFDGLNSVPRKESGIIEVSTRPPSQHIGLKIKPKVTLCVGAAFFAVGKKFCLPKKKAAGVNPKPAIVKCKLNAEGLQTLQDSGKLYLKKQSKIGTTIDKTEIKIASDKVQSEHTHATKASECEMHNLPKQGGMSNSVPDMVKNSLKENPHLLTSSQCTEIKWFEEFKAKCQEQKEELLSEECLNVPESFFQLRSGEKSSSKVSTKFTKKQFMSILPENIV
ncbi:N-acetyltransferase ESCO2-like [Protopterus annectens]|uniref:N-acetyltransferase ESCO2-like n=1 Tax=Protopterus annectens TaxID=7888 RepID=UPI001CFB0006|nr:N-acetyltransferase ESCO2-like [Protopterus annectens]